MNQRKWLIISCFVFIGLAALGLILSNRSENEIRSLSGQNTDIIVKLDELEVEIESMAASARATNSALKEAEQRIGVLEDSLSSLEAYHEGDQEPVNLVWVLFSDTSKLQDWPEVEKALNEYSAEKIGVTCQFRYMDRDVLSNSILDGHEYDIAYTCNWWNDFAKNVAAGNFLDLTDVLKNYPELKDTVLDSAWSCTKVKDHIYAIPHMKDIGCEVFWILNSDYFLKEKGYEKDQYISFEEIEPYLNAYKEDHPDDYPIKIAASGLTSWNSALVDWMNMDTLIGLDWNAQGTSAEHSIRCALEIPAFRERLRTIHRWYELGYINPDAPELDSYPRAEAGVGSRDRDGSAPRPYGRM